MKHAPPAQPPARRVTLSLSEDELAQLHQRMPGHTDGAAVRWLVILELLDGRPIPGQVDSRRKGWWSWRCPCGASGSLPMIDECFDAECSRCKRVHAAPALPVVEAP